MTKRGRTCVVRRERFPRDELIRLTIDKDGNLIAAPSTAGRGAWVTPEQGALERVQKKPELLRRGLRAVPRHTEGLVEQVHAQFLDQLKRSLVLAWRSGVLRVVDASATDTGIILVSSDAPKFEGNAVTMPWSSATLGCLLRRPAIPAFVAFPSRPTRKLLYDLQRWRELGYSPAPSAHPPSR